MEELTDIDKQIILYSKKWFKRTDIITDLKVMISNWSGSELKWTTEHDVYWMVSEAFAKSVSTDNRILIWFLKDDLYRYEETIEIKEMIKRMIGKMAILRTRNGDEIIIDLGEPNYNLLPKSDKR